MGILSKSSKRDSKARKSLAGWDGKVEELPYVHKKSWLAQKAANIHSQMANAPVSHDAKVRAKLAWQEDEKEKQQNKKLFARQKSKWYATPKQRKRLRDIMICEQVIDPFTDQVNHDMLRQAMTKGVELPDDVLERLFKEYDIDNSGDISTDEMARALDAIGIPSDAGVVKKMIQELDVDGDGTISVTEWTMFFKEVEAIKEFSKHQIAKVRRKKILKLVMAAYMFSLVIITFWLCIRASKAEEPEEINQTHTMLQIVVPLLVISWLALIVIPLYNMFVRRSKQYNAIEKRLKEFPEMDWMSLPSMATGQHQLDEVLGRPIPTIDEDGRLHYHDDVDEDSGPLFDLRRNRIQAPQVVRPPTPPPPFRGHLAKLKDQMRDSFSHGWGTISSQLSMRSFGTVNSYWLGIPWLGLKSGAPKPMRAVKQKAINMPVSKLNQLREAAGLPALKDMENVIREKTGLQKIDYVQAFENRHSIKSKPQTTSSSSVLNPFKKRAPTYRIALWRAMGSTSSGASSSAYKFSAPKSKSNRASGSKNPPALRDADRIRPKAIRDSPKRGESAIARLHANPRLSPKAFNSNKSPSRGGGGQLMLLDQYGNESPKSGGRKNKKQSQLGSLELDDQFLTSANAFNRAMKSRENSPKPRVKPTSPSRRQGYNAQNWQLAIPKNRDDLYLEDISDGEYDTLPQSATFDNDVLRENSATNKHVAVTIEDGHPVIGSVVKGFSPFNVSPHNIGRRQYKEQQRYYANEFRRHNPRREFSF